MLKNERLKTNGAFGIITAVRGTLSGTHCFVSISVVVAVAAILERFHVAKALPLYQPQMHSLLL